MLLTAYRNKNLYFTSLDLEALLSLLKQGNIYCSILYIYK